MSKCPKCNAEVEEGSNNCPNCGGEIKNEVVAKQEPCHCHECSCNEHEESTAHDVLTVIAKVFMVIDTVFMGLLLFPLAWCIPMTVHLFHEKKNGHVVGIAFKVCTLLFVSAISGILLLCRTDDYK